MENASGKGDKRGEENPILNFGGTRFRNSQNENGTRRRKSNSKPTVERDTVRGPGKLKAP